MKEVFVLLALVLGTAQAFAPPALVTSALPTAPLLVVEQMMMKPELIFNNLGQELGVFDSQLVLAATTEPWVQPLSIFLGIFFNALSFAMLCRVVLSWYPTANVKEFPWIAIVLPTEPLLRAIKGAIPPAFGVDITPIVWLAFFTFLNEILLGQQGLLTLKMKYGI